MVTNGFCTKAERSQDGSHTSNTRHKTRRAYTRRNVRHRLTTMNKAHITSSCEV